jgi:replicative DNA helicase/5S rRNA maturation endonuclease (ribonuclease M5)
MDNPGKVPKAFSSPLGWPVPLYNQEVLHKDGLKEIVMVEGEANCISAMDHGFADICGVPGANFKKAEWIDTLDKLELEKIYICYDKDKVGQKAAQTLAARIGIEKCWKITLPDFTVTKDDGTTRLGKDLNEYFTVGGGTAESFAKLKEEAVLFDVDGVASSKDSLSEFMDELDGKTGLEPKYKSPWPSQNKLVGFDEGDVIDILAPEKVGKTTYAMNLMEHMCSTYGEDGVFICLEMTRAKMARKWVAHKAQIADNLPKSPEESAELLQKFKTAVPKLQAEVAGREGDFYFCYPKYKDCEELYKLIRDCIRRYGVKWIALDNIQRMADTTPRGAGRNRTEHLSEISKVLSQIAKDYNVQIIRILQPNRIQGNGMVTTDNVDGSSQIAKDCDCMLTLHRPRISNNNQADAAQFALGGAPMEEEATFSDRMLMTVGLSRYSSGGRCELHYDGAMSTVRELEDQQKAMIAAMANHNVGHAAQLKNAGITGLKAAVAKAPEHPPVPQQGASETVEEKETEEIGI